MATKFWSRHFKTKVKKSETSSSTHSLTKKGGIVLNCAKKNLYAVRNERKNGNIVQRSFSDILFSKIIEQCFAKFCLDLVKSDPRTNTTLFLIYAFPFMVNYAFITTGKFCQSLILQSNLALVKHLNQIFVPRIAWASTKYHGKQQANILDRQWSSEADFWTDSAKDRDSVSHSNI